MADLTTLELQGNHIGGSIPNLTPHRGAELYNLGQMNLARNKLTGTIPSDIGDLHRLQTLFLESNKLEGSIPSEIGNLQTLKQARLCCTTTNSREACPYTMEVCDLTTDEDLVYLGADCTGDLKCECCTKCF